MALQNPVLEEYLLMCSREMLSAIESDDKVTMKAVLITQALAIRKLKQELETAEQLLVKLVVPIAK